LSTFRVPVLTIDGIVHHPQADRLSICQVRGYSAVTAKNPDGTHAFAQGQRIAYVPEGSILPGPLLRDRGLWHDKLGIGRLAGPAGDRVSAIELRGRLSQGLVWPLPPGYEGAEVGTDLAGHFGIVKYVPEVPPELLGQVMVRMEAKMGYDLEALPVYPDLLARDEVVATEKLHGVCAEISVLPGLSDPLLFGGGCVAITSKGLAEQGMVFKDVPANADNPYVAAASGEAGRIRAWAEANAPGQRVVLVAEVFGRGIQDLHYGGPPRLRCIDLRLGRAWLDDDDKAAAFAALGLGRVPVLYRGPFDPVVLDALRRGTTTLGGGHIREGIVVTAVGPQDKRLTDLGDFVRPTLKYHNPEYLVRKGGTEYR